MKKIIIALVIITITQFGFAQNNSLEKGWEAFNNNELYDAIDEFENAKKNSADKAEASLAQAIIYEELLKTKKAKESFKEFFESSKNPYPYIYAMWNIDGMLMGPKFDKKFISFLKEIHEDERANGLMKALINEKIFNIYAGEGKMKKARQYSDAIGSIKKWRTLGVFENISASGFNKDFEVLAHPEASYVFKNKRNVDIKWFDVVELKNSRWIDFTYHHYISNSIIYAQTFCNSPSSQEVQLRIGTSGSVKVWLNDNLVISDDEETNNNLDTYIKEIKLNKGNNRILIQVGSSEISRSNFMCRITDNNGKPIEGLEYTVENKDYDKSYTYVGKDIPNPYEVFFENKVKENPKKIFYHLLLAKSYWKNSKSYKTRKILKKAEEIAPKSTYIQVLKAVVLNRDDNSSGLSKLLEKLKENDPDSYLALDLEYSDVVGKENYEEAEKILEKIESNFGKTASTYSKRIDLAGNNNEIKKLEDLVNKAYKKYPNNYKMVNLKYQVEKQINKSSTAYKILKKYNRKNYHPSAKEDLAKYYISKGMIQEVKSIYEDLSENHPVALGYKNTLAQIEYAMKNYGGAIDYYNKCLEIAPYISAYHEGKGRSCEDWGKEDKAIEYYKKVIELNPNDYDVREKLRKLEGKDKLFDVFKEIPSPEDFFNNSPTAKDYPEDKSIILLEEDQKIVYKDGASEEKHYRMIKMLNASGVDNWKEYSISVFRNQSLNIEEAKVYKKDGSKIDGEKSYNSVVFTDLEVGDAIYVEYKIKNYNSGKLAKHFWDSHYFDYYIPVKRNVYSLLVHKDKKFTYKMANSDMKPTKTSKGDFYLYVWKRKDVPAIKSEPYMPPLVDVGQMLHISSFTKWSQISDWYTDLAETKQDADFELKEKVKEIFKGKENLSDREKAELIYNYIVKDIRYSSISFRQSGLIPQKASKVINTKLGDCKDVSTLFVTMCKEVGVKANLVLVNTRNQGDDDIILPTINFNHCIARVKTGNEEHYIELTSDKLPFSTMGSSLINANALNIENNAELISLSSKDRVQNTVERQGKITFNGDNMLVEKTNKKGGLYSAYMRSTYRDIGEEKQRKAMTKAIQGVYIKTKLKKLEFDETLKNNTPYINYKYSYIVEEVYNDVGGMYIFKLPFADNQNVVSFISTEERKYPISIWDYSSRESESEVLTIFLPSDKKLVKLPSNLSYSNKFFNYSLNYKKVGKKLIVTRKFNYKLDTVNSSDYKAFKKEFEKVIKADKRQLAFK